MPVVKHKYIEMQLRIYVLFMFELDDNCQKNHYIRTISD